MDANDAGDRPDSAVLELYQTLRNEVKHEDDLIGQRVNWFTASQAFLLVSLAIAHKGETAMPTPANNHLFPLVPIVALSASVFIFVGVIAGISALAQWRGRLKQLTQEHTWLPRLIQDWWIVPAAWSAPIALPLLFIGAWAYLVVYGYLIR